MQLPPFISLFYRGGQHYRHNCFWQNVSLRHLGARRAQRHHNCQGFSLVEIVIALGVVAFTYSTLLALLPVGLKTFKEAADTAVEASIIQRTVSDLQQTSFSLFSGPNYIRTFTCDDQGQATTDEAQALYTITVTRASETTLPVASGVEPQSSSLVTLNISIVNKTRPLSPNIHSAIVASR